MLYNIQWITTDSDADTYSLLLTYLCFLFNKFSFCITMVFIIGHSVPAKILLKEQCRVEVDFLGHLLLVRDTRDSEAVKLDKLLQGSRLEAGMRLSVATL